MFAGAVSLFLVNVIAKKTFDSEGYASFVIYLLVISLLSTLSMLGFENVLLKDVIVDRGTPIVSIGYIKYALAMTLVSLFLYLITIRGIYNFSYHVTVSHLLYLISFSACTFLSTLLRLRENFVEASLMVNLWKILLFILFFLVGVGGLDFSESLYFIPSIVLVVISFFCFFYYRGKFKVEIFGSLNFRNVGFMHVGFLLGLLYFSGLNSYDKFILEKQLKASDFAEYAYFLSIMLYPINIVAAFVGYKELVDVKKGGFTELGRSLSTIVLKTFIYFSLYSVFIYSISDYLAMRFYLDLWFLILLFVLIRMPYSLLSAVIGVKSDSYFLVVVNFIFISALVLFALVVYFAKSFYVAVSLVTISYLVRNVVYYHKAKILLRG